MQYTEKRRGDGMGKLAKKRDYFLVGIVIILFILMSFLSLTSINQLRGNARVVNYAGIVRGATQRLVKKELMGYPDDALLKRLDSIVNELITGEGSNDLVVLNNKTYLNNMDQVKESWEELKMEIMLVREGKDSSRLFELSEDYFTLVDKTVSSAEQYSESQVQGSTRWLLGINAVFIFLILIGVVTVVRSASLKRKAEALGKIAYIDPLTQMANRASCEQEIDKYLKKSPKEDFAVFMFDMNNLKRVNDLLGHQGGDRIIADFARILKVQAAEYGFVARYGGDEFIGIFPDASDETINKYLTQVNERVIAYNLLHVNEIEKISFAVGYVIENMKDMSLEDMINKADRKMYICKRKMKENKES